ncbi:hypothetical protein GA0074692_0027 [Micromonospora pallida]|uniref:Uncharacterized protein n=1 Tax=Micromonospora pallida TaxID=145854 RepID=A0A1C6RH95_9ACTN|nr:hypothetical protein [Micromonospora pallida]SCL16428.1 hypothetical protein GA0074692_0027 [Micromonospora pallida]
MPADTALADALATAYSPTELATLHQHLVDDAPQDDPLGRLCDALHAAAYQSTPGGAQTSTGTPTEPTVYATHGTRA